MPKLQNFFFFFFLFFFTCVFALHREDHSVAANDQKNDTAIVRIGVLLDLSSPLDSMIDVCLSIALSDFYAAHPDYKSRLRFDTRNVEGELNVDFAVLEMLKNGEIHGVLGPQWSKEPTFVVELGARAQIPVISFTAKARSFLDSQSPYFVRATLDDQYQVRALAAICENFQWHELVVLYEDTEYGSLFVSKLNKGFQEADIQLASMVAISTSAKDSEIIDILKNLMAKQTRVFLVHMNIALGQRLFVRARTGMMIKGYAWLISDMLSYSLSSVDSSSMENVLGIRPHVPKSKSLDSFKEKWIRTSLLMKPENTVMDLNLFGFRAYDVVWGLAMAVEKAMPPMFDVLNSSQGGNISQISNIKVSQFGQRVLTELLNTKFTGLSGEFQLVDGQLQPLAFEIFNVVGTGDRTVGYWSPATGISSKVFSEVDSTYSTSTKELRAIMWPGDTLVPPKGWDYPTAGKKLKVGVPMKDGFTEFVNVQEDPLTHHYSFSGFCIDIFLASLNHLPFELDYEFVHYPGTSEDRNGSYNDMLHQIANKTYDFVVGDVTILANRSTFVDFMLPYTDSGVVMVLKNKKSRNMWTFLQPLRWDLWLTIVSACIFVGCVLGVLEHRSNGNDISALTPQDQQLRLFFWLPIAVLAFPERNMVASKWSLFVLVIWLFVTYILMQSYTAKLSSIFTVDQLNFAFSTDYNVGYQHGSFVKDFLLYELHLNETKLKPYATVQEYHDAMHLGSKKGGIDAIYAEIPYMRLLLDRYGSEYRIVGPTHKTDGLGFAFPRDSPLVIHFSRAILNVTQSPGMAGIERNNFGPGYPSDLNSINQDNPSLTAYNFGGLFIIVISATMFALFCSKTAVGRRFASMVSNVWNFPVHGSEIAEDHSSRGSTRSREEGEDIGVNNSNASPENDANVSAGQGEVQLPERNSNADTS